MIKTIYMIQSRNFAFIPQNM